jgi:hypothetical protein
VRVPIGLPLNSSHLNSGCPNQGPGDTAPFRLLIDRALEDPKASRGCDHLSGNGSSRGLHPLLSLLEADLVRVIVLPPSRSRGHRNVVSIDIPSAIPYRDGGTHCRPHRRAFATNAAAARSLDTASCGTRAVSDCMPILGARRGVDLTSAGRHSAGPYQRMKCSGSSCPPCSSRGASNTSTHALLRRTTRAHRLPPSVTSSCHLVVGG